MSAIALGRRSLTYALGGFAYKGVALLALPILARLLSPAELGLLDLAAVLAAVVGLTAALGSDQGVAFLESRADASAGVWAATVLMLSVIAGGFVVVAIVAGGPIAERLTGDSANAIVVLAACLYGWVVALTTTALNAIRLHGSPRTYALASFIIVTVEMGAALTIAWRFEFPVALMVLAWAGGAAMVVIPLLLRYVPAWSRPTVTTLRRLIAFGAPLVPATIAWLVGDAWIRSVLAQHTGLTSLGEYGIAFRVASVIVLAVTGFGVAWQPYIFRSPPAEVHTRASGLIVYLVLALGGGAAALTALAPEIIWLVAGDAYARAREIVATLAGGAVIMGAFVLISAVVGASGSTRRIGWAAVAGAATQIAAAPPLIGALGLVGAGAASLAGYLVAVVVLVAGERQLLRGPNVAMAALSTCLVAIGIGMAALTQDWPFVGRLVLLIGLGVTAAVMAMLHRGRMTA